MGRGLARDLALALAAVLAITLAVAAGAALRVADEQGWIAAGFYRLVVCTAWDRFDAWLPFAAAAALAVAALVQLVRRLRRQRQTSHTRPPTPVPHCSRKRKNQVDRRDAGGARLPGGHA